MAELVLRLVDTMIFKYFYAVDLLRQLLQLPDLAVATPVRREVHRNWDTRYPDIGTAVEAAIEAGQVAVCDFDPNDGVEATLHFQYRDVHGFGDGESAMMVLSVARGHPFISHDLAAAGRMRKLGVKVKDWQDLLGEMLEKRLISGDLRNAAIARIQSMMRGR